MAQYTVQIDHTFDVDDDTAISKGLISSDYNNERNIIDYFWENETASCSVDVTIDEEPECDFDTALSIIHEAEFHHEHGTDDVIRDAITGKINNIERDNRQLQTAVDTLIVDKRGLLEKMKELRAKMVEADFQGAKTVISLAQLLDAPETRMNVETPNGLVIFKVNS